MFQSAISYNLGNNILFDKINYGENFLFLYNGGTKHRQIFSNFIKSMVKKDDILFYISHKTNQLHFDFEMRNFHFNMISDEVIQRLKGQLDKCFNEVEKKGDRMFLFADWSGAKLSDCEIFLPFLNTLIKKSKGITPPGWKRRYKQLQQKTPFLLVNAFETTNLDHAFLQQLISLHQRIYLLQEDLNIFMLPTISPSLETIFPKSHVLPQEILEKLVKDNLELTTLLFLENSSKSGYQILKDIAQHFHCILSQGTLYPLLYQLEKENKIAKQNGKGREIIYSLTQKTKKEMGLRKETLLNAYQHLASFFENGGKQGKTKEEPKN